MQMPRISKAPGYATGRAGLLALGTVGLALLLTTACEREAVPYPTVTPQIQENAMEKPFTTRIDEIKRLVTYNFDVDKPVTYTGDIETRLDEVRQKYQYASITPIISNGTLIEFSVEMPFGSGDTFLYHYLEYAATGEKPESLKNLEENLTP